MTKPSFDESPVENAGIDQTWIENVMKGAMSAERMIWIQDSNSTTVIIYKHDNNMVTQKSNAALCQPGCCRSSCLFS